MKMILSAAVLLLFQIAAQSQIKARAKKQTHTNAVYKKKTSKAETTSSNSPAVFLHSTEVNHAKANGSKNNLTISDPIITTMDARAGGANISLGKSGIVGMPKRAYGFANGHISLMSNGSTTSGTQTGSGSVGTGSSTGTFGSVGPSINVNGKSSNAGINMWGNAMNMMMIYKTDTTTKIRSMKNQ